MDIPDWWEGLDVHVTLAIVGILLAIHYGHTANNLLRKICSRLGVET